MKVWELTGKYMWGSVYGGAMEWDGLRLQRKWIKPQFNYILSRL